MIKKIPLKQLMQAMLIVIALGMLTAYTVIQEEDKKKVRIKVIKEVNGNKTTIDTLIYVSDEPDIQAILNEYNVDFKWTENLDSINKIKVLSKIGDESVFDILDLKGDNAVWVMKTHGDSGEFKFDIHVDSMLNSLSDKHAMVFSSANGSNFDVKKIKNKEGIVFVYSTKSKDGKELKFDIDVHDYDSLTLHGKQKIFVKSDNDGEDITVEFLGNDVDTSTVWKSVGKDIKLSSNVIFKEIGEGDEQVFVVRTDKTDVKHIKPGEKMESIVWLDKNSGDSIQISEKIIISNDDKVQFYANDSVAHKVIFKSTTNDSQNTVKVKVIANGNELKTEHLEKEVIIWKGETDSEMYEIIIETISDEDKPKMKEAGIKTKVKEELELDNLHFYPNPSDGRFTLAFDIKEPKDLDINVYDITGKTIYKRSQKIAEGTYKDEIDISKQPKGTYFLQILSGKQTLNRKLMIK